MTNLQQANSNWQDDIEALGGDFDGSLSGLCIMSLSFDFTRSGLGSVAAAAGGSHTPTTGAAKSGADHLQQQSADPTSVAGGKLAATSALSLHQHNQELLLNENSMNAFKRFKSSLRLGAGSSTSHSADLSENANQHLDDCESSRRATAMSASDSSKQIVRQLQQQIKNCLGGGAASPTHLNSNNNTQTTTTLSAHYSSISQRTGTIDTEREVADDRDDDHDDEVDDEDKERASFDCTPLDRDDSSHPPTDTGEEEEEEDEDEDDDDGDDIESLRSASNSLISSISINSRSSTRSRLLADMSPHNNQANNNSHDLRIGARAALANASQTNSGANRHRDRRRRQRHQRPHSDNESPASSCNQPAAASKMPRPSLSSFSVKENLLSGANYNEGNPSLKESSYTTSVITTTAPMHFKSLHHHRHRHAHAHHHPPPPPPHAFSTMKHQFPPSPYHQFSNSSFNHDFYDRYLSHDSHQPLQTPLIGIERTQDLLALKLPPHGPDTDTDSQRFTKEWLFGGGGGAGAGTNGPPEEQSGDHQRPGGTRATESKAAEKIIANDLTTSGPNRRNHQRRDSDDSASSGRERRKSFQFSGYKSANSNTATTLSANNSAAAAKREPLDLNVSFGQKHTSGQNGGQHDDDDDDYQKSNMFNESMKHFNPNQMLCYGRGGDSVGSDVASKQPGIQQQQSSVRQINSNASGSAAGSESNGANALNMGHQEHAQESMFGLVDQAAKQKFQYILAAPISVATKITEDTMTYLNQSQAYEIKLENVTDVSEAKKGFMCSIINIGFHERHMQQAENELWQQWSQQHPSERIFSVDMKLSYNVFGVDSDGLNKYEFLWDSSKAAGVFIRINSISTEFTPRKHGGEKGIPFKLSIETFSYNSKTHDSYFISAACCQIKVFKPKGAERKIRSDRDKIFKRPPSDLDKYHQSCDHTVFRDCSLSSLHPLVADDSIGYYRHSHGHFASKQINGSARATPAASRARRCSQTGTSDNQTNAGGSSTDNNSTTSSSNNNNNDGTKATAASTTTSADRKGPLEGDKNSRDYLTTAGASVTASVRTHTDYSTSRLLQPTVAANQHYGNSDSAHYYGHHSESEISFSATAQHQSEVLHHTNPLSHVYHQTGNSAASQLQRNTVPNLSSGGSQNNSQQPFNMAYYHHSATGSHAAGSSNSAAIPQPPPLPPPLAQHANYGGLLSSGNSSLGGSTIGGPAYQAAAVAAATASSRTGPAAVYRPQATPFRASNLALASNSNTDNGDHCADTSQPELNGSQPMGMGSYHHPNQQDHHQHPHSHSQQHSSFDANDMDGSNNLNSSHGGENSSASLNGGHQNPSQHPTHHQQLASSYRQRSASTSLMNPMNAHCSSYVSSVAGNFNHHQHSSGASRAAPMLSDCYGSLDNVTHSNSHSHTWTGGANQHTNAGCLSRGCSANSNCLNLQPTHHYHSTPAPVANQLGDYAQNSIGDSLLHHNQHHHQQQHLHHYEQHSEQDSPHKSHNSNDSPLSCYSRFRDAVGANNDTTNTMSSYSSQQQQQHHHHHHQAHLNHQGSQARNQHGHREADGHDEHAQMEILSRSSSSLFNPSERINADSSCAEVLAWLIGNRFGLFTKTFNNFSGSDLLRLSKPELVEICGLPDGIRLFNSLHNQPIRARHKNKTFRMIKFAHLKRELRLKRKLK